MRSSGSLRGAVSLCWLIFGLGAALRVFLWSQGRPLWLDETYLVENILDRTFGQLLLPLGHSQSAPILFLWAVKATVLVAGTSEPVLRFFPLVCSAVHLALWLALLRRVTGNVGLVVGGLWAAASFRLVYYAQEVKQYSAEACVTTAIAWAAARYWEADEDPTRRRWLWLIGALSLGLSHTAVFPLAAFGVVECLRQGRRLLRIRQQTVLLGAAVIWLPLFLVNFVWVIRGNFDDPVMKRFWDFAYLGLPWGEGGLDRWRTLITECLYYFGWREELSVVGPSLLGLGLWSGIRERNRVTLMSASALGLFGIASVLRLAPIYERLVVFLFPCVLLLCAAGVQFLWDWLTSKVARVTLGLAVVVLLVLSARREVYRYQRPLEQPSPAPLVAEVMQKAQPGDTIVVTPWTGPGLHYYAPADWRRNHNLIKIEGPLAWEAPKRPHRPAIPQLNVPLAIANTDWSTAGSRVWLLTFKPSQRGRELATAVGQRLQLGWSPVLESEDGGVYFLSPPAQR